MTRMNHYAIDWKEYADIARLAAAEGVVLIKNDKDTLPMRKNDQVAVFGRIQLDYYKSGTGSGGMINTRYVVSIIDALKEINSIQLNQELLSTYENWVKENPYQMGEGWAGEPWSQEEMPISEELVKKIKSDSDLALVVIGRTAGEDKDNKAEAGSYLLTTLEEDLLEKVCRHYSRVAVVLNVGNIIDMKWVDRYNPGAVLYAWHGGQEGGHGVVDVLSGKINPSGKLTDTIAYDIMDYPSTKNFGDRLRNYYKEDIYVGYRYFETFAKEKVRYPFGYGLSYTNFELNVLSFSCLRPDGKSSKGNYPDDVVSITVQVSNVGAFPGKEVIQVYASAPQGVLGKPAKELRAFTKTELLRPKENGVYTLSISMKDLASYDDEGKTGNQSTYVLEKGSYRFYIGSDIRSAVEAGSINVDELIIVEKHEEALAPTREFERLTPREQELQYHPNYQPVPLRTNVLKERISERRPLDRPYHGDQGYQLVDVKDGKIGLEEFLDQLSGEDLIHLSRGEGMCSPKVTPGTAGAFGGVTPRLKNYGIPVACCADGPSGIRMDCGSFAFNLPNGTALACTFNTDLVEKLYIQLGKELRKNQIDLILGPGMNIHRSPLNGRNFEYFSEDPLLTGKMGAACNLGLRKYGVYGVAKHFAANNQELGRFTSDSVVSERALREIYLKGFEIFVKEGKGKAIMSSYNAINGIWTAGNYDLITTILRGEWGFEGIVMTDWWAHMNEDGEETASAANTHYMIRAQNDLFMVVADAQLNSGKDLSEAGLENNTICRGELLRNGANICRFLMDTPAMDRFIGRVSEQEKQNYQKVQEEDQIRFELPYQFIDQSLSLDLSDLKTNKGETSLFGLSFKERGFYDISFRMRVHGGELAQVPLTLFVGSKVLTTITRNGTKGEWVEEKRDLGLMFMPNAYLKLYFAQSGMEIEEITITLREVFDISKFREK